MLITYQSVDCTDQIGGVKTMKNKRNRILKFLSSFLIILVVGLIVTSSTMTVNAETNNDSSSYELFAGTIDDEFPETVTINGEEKNVRVVTLEEYNSDTSGDFLILINDGSHGEVSLLDYNEANLSINSFGLASSIQPFGWLDRIAIYLADKVVGYVVEKGIEYLVTSGVGKAVFTKAATAFLAVWPYALAIAAGVAIAYMVYKAATYSVSKVTNSSGCVWSGPRVGGVWMCPMRLTPLKM